MIGIQTSGSQTWASSELPEGFIKPQKLSARVSDSIGPEKSPRICLSDKFWDNTVAAGPLFENH